jgi:hypothetical protein
MNQIIMDSLGTGNFGGVIENMPTVPEIEFRSSKQRSIKTKPSTFNDDFQDKLNNAPVAPVVSIPIEPIETNSAFDQTIVSNAIDFIFILIVVIILWKVLIKRSFNTIFSKIFFRFSATGRTERFEKNIVVLKKLLETGVISQNVYDSRMNDLLKRRLK